jgi:hypothetical protein
MNPVQHAGSRQLQRLASLKNRRQPAISLQDQAWEGDLLSLLCALETWRTRLSEFCQANQPVPALETILVIVGRLTSFLDQHWPDQGDESQAVLRSQIDELVDRAGRLRGRLQKTPVQRLLRLLGYSNDEGDPRQLFVASAQGMYEVLVSAFELFTQQFRSPAAAHGWLDAHPVFLADLLGLVEQLRPS